MKNKLLLPIFLLLFCMTLILTGCGGGGGTGSSSAPGGVNAGVPTVVTLLPVQFIAQTNSFITLKVRVLDGNGNAVQNYPVNFTNMSLLGNLSAVTANTNEQGNAEVRISSTTPGFATILAQVTAGSGIVRDVKTVYFTSLLSMNLAPTMMLDVDGNDSNTIYNEPGDYNLFETSNDTQVTIRATVFDSIGFPASGRSVIFGSDFPYKVGSDPAATCSDGSTTCAVSFPLGNTATTDSNGEAFVLVQVAPTVLSSITTVLNITATADNGAFNLTSLFLNPVAIGSVVVSAAPTTVESNGVSAISATVRNSAGGPVPDGTTVNFTSTAGALSAPFAQTTAGLATTDLTAPTVTIGTTTVTVTAAVGGLSGTTVVTVTAPVVPPPPPSPPPTPVALTVVPATVTVIGAAPFDIVTFTITGGTPPYTTNSSDPTKACNDAAPPALPTTANGSCSDPVDTGTWTGSSVKVTIPAGALAGPVTINVFDSVGATKVATITIL